MAIYVSALPCYAMNSSGQRLGHIHSVSPVSDSAWHKEGAHVGDWIKFSWQKPKRFKMTVLSCSHRSWKGMWLALDALNALVSYSNLWEIRAHYHTGFWPTVWLICTFHLSSSRRWKIGCDMSYEIIFFFFKEKWVVVIAFLVSDCRYDQAVHLPLFKLSCW